MLLIAKLCLPSALQCRVLRSITLEVILLPKDNTHIQAAQHVTKQWAEQIKDANQET